MAQQAMALEDRLTYPFRAGQQHSAKYFELLAQRRRLPISALREQFLDAYHKAQARLTHVSPCFSLPSNARDYLTFHRSLSYQAKLEPGKRPRSPSLSCLMSLPVAR